MCPVKILLCVAVVGTFVLGLEVLKEGVYIVTIPLWFLSATLAWEVFTDDAG